MNKIPTWCNNSSVYFTYRLALHVSGFTSTHHQERQECTGRYGIIVGSVYWLCAVLDKMSAYFVIPYSCVYFIQFSFGVLVFEVVVSLFGFYGFQFHDSVDVTPETCRARR